MVRHVTDGEPDHVPEYHARMIAFTTPGEPLNPMELWMMENGYMPTEVVTLNQLRSMWK